MFQTDSVALLFSRVLAWERVRDGSVAYMTVAF
jgi:hypothetical protein